MFILIEFISIFFALSKRKMFTEDFIKQVLSFELISIENLSQVKDLFEAISSHARSNGDFQSELGNEAIFSLISKFLTYSLDEANCLPNDHVEAVLNAWLRLCRREILQKDTRNLVNLESSEKYLEQLILLLGKYIASENCIYYGCALMMVLASDSTERQQLLGTLKGPALVVSILHNYSSNSKIAEIACRVVRNLSADDEVANQLTQEGVGEILHNILMSIIAGTFDIDFPLIEAIIYAFINLSYDSNISLILGSVGVCVSVVDIIPLVLKHDSICSPVCGVIRNLSTIKQNITILKFTNVCEYLMDIMKAYRNDSEIMQSALWCISNLVCHLQLAHRLYSLEIVPFMIESFHYGTIHYPEDIQLGPIAEAITFAIFNLTAAIDQLAEKKTETEGEIPSEESLQAITIVKDGLGQMGICSLLAEFLTRYRIREAMVEACFRSIAILSYNSPYIKNLFYEQETIPKIVDIFNYHEEVIETVFNAWRAIVALVADSPQNKLQLKNIPQIEQRVVLIMKTYHTYEEMLCLGCTILIHLDQYDDSKLAQLLHDGFLAEMNDEEASNEPSSLGKKQVIMKETFEIMSAAWELDRINPAAITESSK